MCILPRLKIIHFNPSRTLLKELMFTFMMNLSSNSSKENGKRKDKDYRCSYCEKVFDSQDLRGHQREHEVEIKRRIN